MENNKETFGDFTILDEVASKLTGGFSGNSGDIDFPIMDIRDDDDESFSNLDDEDKKSGGFKDERTGNDNDSDGEEASDIPEGDALEGNTDEGDASLGEGTDIDESLDTDLGDNGEDDQSNKDTGANPEKKKNTGETEGSVSELGDAEPEITAFVQEKLFDKLGWELDEKDSMKDVDSLVDYMEKIVEANSKPNYASKDIEDLNQFVNDGGNLKDYFDAQGEVDIENIDLSVDFNQKLVIKEALKERGLTDTQANKKIQRYDESGILEEEALDSKEYVQKLRQDKAQTLLKEQREAQQFREQQQQKFYEDVNSTIDNLKDIRGLSINKAKKNKLRDAILKVGADGQTLYQKQYQENLIQNMLESAFFTLEKDALVKGLTQQAESRATKNLKDKLKTRTKKGKGSGSLDTDVTSSHKVLDVFNNFIKP